MSSPLRSRPARLAAALATALLVPLAGCGGDVEPAEDSSTSDAASPSPSDPSETPDAAPEPSETPAALADEPPLPKAPKAKDTPDARKAWTRFVVERWGYALATNDASAVSDLAPKGKKCDGCKDLEKELSKRSKQGWVVDFPGATVKKVTVEPSATPDTYLATAVIDVPASRSYFEDGTFRNDNEAFKGAEFKVEMRRTKDAYLLLAYVVG